MGLALGDAASSASSDPGPLPGTCLTQLACFTLEGAIRACVRQDNKGICDPPSVIWHALARWAHIQGLGPQFAENWTGGSTVWPDGWLHHVRPLSIRRGDAPATVQSLTASPGVPERPRTTSGGHHAVTRVLPIAIMGFSDPAGMGSEVAALTHGQEDALLAAASAVSVATQLLVEGEPSVLERAVEISGRDLVGTAAHALHHGAQAALSADDFETLAQSAGSHGKGPMIVGAAMFGALHGVDALGHVVSRLEVGWVADRLAGDAVAERLDHPAGTEYSTGSDPMWWSNYPGW
ncbi:MAG TPA: hypothetical protein VM143_14595 [Acidimicrobiales bacterium]|nr:hypothetical protein [Acidimicrobiales bacterium]